MTNMNRGVKIGFLALSAIIVFAAIFPNLGKAATQRELNQEIEAKNTDIAKLEEEIKGYQNSLDDTNQTAKTLRGQVRKFDLRIKNLAAEISLTQVQINKKELEIEKLSFDIGSTEENLENRRELLKGILQELNEKETESLVEIILQYGTLSSFFDTLESIRSLDANLRQNYEELSGFKTLLEKQKTTAQVTQNKLVGFRIESRDRKKLEEIERGDKNQLLKVTKNQEAKYQKILKEREAEREAILKEIQDIEDELRKLIDPTKLPEADAGVLAWPIDGAVLTQSFGTTPDSKILYNGQPHNGIDIRARIGTELYAAEDGEVINTGNTDSFSRCLSYGKWILIKHPNNLATLYAHLSLIKVSPGDIIERGELIGYSGASGYATGPHLHFTVYDANTVEFRASSRPGSTCKLLPFGGYLNPLAYL